MSTMTINIAANVSKAEAEAAIREQMADYYRDRAIQAERNTEESNA